MFTDPGTMEVNDLRKLIRAYNLLAASCDDLRAIVGKVSRDWIASEIERDIPLADIPAATLSTVRGRDILAEELLGNKNLGPADIDLQSLDFGRDLSCRTINSNRLPKLEPLINAAVLVGNMLLGVQRYGNKGRGDPSIDNDLIVAAILRDSLGRKHYHSALLPSDCDVIDDTMIIDLFGQGVLNKLTELNTYWDLFQKSLDSDTLATIEIAAPYANVIAAIAAGRLRLTARAAGDEIFSTLDNEKRTELRSQGISVDGEHPERPYLDADYRIARAALNLPHVDYNALREPLGSTLLLAVADALEDDNKIPRLVGRRGKAIHDVHNNMPMMEYYNASEYPDAFETVHVAALDLMRHLDKCRRKSYNTMLAHAFHIAGTIEATLGDAMEPRLASMALLHDIVEDGSESVAGYDQSLHKLKLRFGGPLAAIVAELTDSHSHHDGPKKAQATLASPYLAQPEEQYNVDRFSPMKLRPTDTEQPYTLDGIIVKLADTAVTFEEGVRNPELMSGWWRHSGIRIYWAQKTRGSIVYPLTERLVKELIDSRTDSNYSLREGALRKAMLEGLRRLLMHTLDWADRYVITNLAILAREYQLSADEHAKLQSAFFNTHLDNELFNSDVLETLFPESRLEQSINAGIVPDAAHVTLYRYRKDSDAEKDPSTFLDYRTRALWRQSVRDELGDGRCNSRREKDAETVLALFSNCMRSK